MLLLLIFATFFLLPPATESAPRARQYLPAVPGFIPVYIRPGNTPLEEINPDLAEAFAFHARKQASSRSHIPVVVRQEDDVSNHIQKIPRV